ncbi:MAG TPA: iron export ABC transporter permease subunit FetB [Malonomonas sp.]
MIDLTLLDLALVYGLVLLAAALVRLRGGEIRGLLIAALRMGLQLFAVGYLLHLIFALESAAPVLLVLLLMGGMAVHTVAGRIKEKMPHFYKVVGSAMLVGCGGGTIYFCVLVIGPDPWYDPRYLIPLSGMIIGNAMTGASLAAERLAQEIRARRDEVETALCLGATARQASLPAVRSALNAALIPSVNAMAAMGIVFLPGMMTGQILSGTEPMIAVKYQIAIMCVITGSVAVTSVLILQQGYRSYFSRYDQLQLPEKAE